MTGLTLFVTETVPAESAVYTGAAADPRTGTPFVNPTDRGDFLEGVEGDSSYSSRPGIPNPLEWQSDAIPATADVGGWPGMPQHMWYDSLRQNAGYPLPVPVDSGVASQMEASNDTAALQANYDFGIDDYDRFNQENLNPGNTKITERTFDVPTPWKAEPTFPVTIQKVRPWDKILGAWPWRGTKAEVPQQVQPPVYYPYELADGIPSPTGAARAMVPNTPSLSPYPMTYRVIPEQWDTDFVYSGV